MQDKYRDYFDIDPEYMHQINNALIEKKPDLWKKFYPHQTFVKLLNDTLKVLTRIEKRSLWVEGAYGTGKSHAVLTLKKLLEVDDDETKAYFDEFSSILSHDMYNKLLNVKHSGKILTVHRYGMSNYREDNDLIIAIQESIEKELDKNNLKFVGESLRSKMLDWMSRDYAPTIIEEYKDKFGGASFSQVKKWLETYDGEELVELMRTIMEVGKEEGFTAIQMDITTLINWIKEVIEINNLKAIMFIWDEFSEFFRLPDGTLNYHLTGFQQILEMSNTEPFYMVIVTHSVTHLFDAKDKDWKKIMDRFVNPICEILLPDNMAFDLMGYSMRLSQDTRMIQEMEGIREDLYDRTPDSREIIMKKAGINNKALKKIMPIHPYTAIILKYISTSFDSNQRSMFDFISSDNGEDIKGFQYYINNYGPGDANPFLSVDMLWDFFYEKGKEHLAQSVRAILDCYPMSKSKNLNKDQQRVFKAVLLMRAIYQSTANSVELFQTNIRNLTNAFEGTDLNYDVRPILNSLCREEVLYKKTLPGGKEEYTELTTTANTEDLQKEIEKQKDKDTSSLIEEGEFKTYFESGLSHEMKPRYELQIVTAKNINNIIKRAKSEESTKPYTITAIIAIAKDAKERSSIKSYIEKEQNNNPGCVLIDATGNTFEGDLFEQYVNSKANSEINKKQDRDLANQYSKQAKENLHKWIDKILKGEFIVYDLEHNTQNVSTIDGLNEYLKRIDRKKYPLGLENIAVVANTMWTSANLGQGAECGINEETKGTYRNSNAKNKLENYLEGAWKIDNYWEVNPNITISKIKKDIDELINSRFITDGQISIREIYDFLKGGKYGFMPCNLTAFVIGFLLKEYVREKTYNYSDGSISQLLSAENLKDMIAEIIKNEMNPANRYKDKYIAKMTPDEKAFIDASAEIFNLARANCVTSEKTRELIRQKMRDFSFPIWVLKYIHNEKITSSESSISELIDNLLSVVNSGNFSKTDKQSALDAGKFCINNKSAVADLAKIMNREKINEGMKEYLHIYSNGELIGLANEIGDSYDYYMIRLKEKFSVNDANWVWNYDTANQKIDDLILEYHIIAESNKILPKNEKYESTIKEWCDHVRKIHISYIFAKNDFGELSDLMEMLYDIKISNGKLRDDKRAEFLKQITNYGKSFKDFYLNPIEIFKKSCSFILYDLDDDEISEVYKRITSDCFTDDKSTYQNKVKDAKEKYQSERGSEKMKSLWKDKTGSASPREWSTAHRMPILYMIKEGDVNEARKVFDTLNCKSNSTKEIEKAIKFIENATFLDKLNDQNAIDEAFRNLVLKQYSVIFDDLEEIRDELTNRSNYEPYDWWGLPKIDEIIKETAQYKYNDSGCNKALEKIDDMDVADVKRYLKELIRDNMTVGIEIIKGK